MKRVIAAESNDSVEDNMKVALDECKDTFDYVVSGIEHLMSIHQLEDAQAVISQLDESLNDLVDDIAIHTVE